MRNPPLHFSNFSSQRGTTQTFAVAAAAGLNVGNAPGALPVAKEPRDRSVKTALDIAALLSKEGWPCKPGQRDRADNSRPSSPRDLGCPVGGPPSHSLPRRRRFLGPKLVARIWQQGQSNFPAVTLLARRF